MERRLFLVYPESGVGLWGPPCWSNFVESIPFDERRTQVDLILQNEFHGILIDTGVRESHVRFDTEEDLVKFVLKWS